MSRILAAPSSAPCISTTKKSPSCRALGAVRHLAVIDRVGGRDDAALAGLAEHLGEPHHRHDAGGDDVARAPGPGPTEGNWSASPTRTSGAHAPAAASSSACISSMSIMLASSAMTQVGARAGRISGGGTAGAGIDLEQAVDASWPRVRCSRPCAWRRARSARRARSSTSRESSALMMVSMIVVLPTPGPPVMTRSLVPSAVSTARACAGARRLSRPRLGGEHGLAEPVGAPGRRCRRPAASAALRRRLSAFHRCGRK